MAQRILGYGSLIGHWGVTRLTAALPPHLHWIHLFYAHYGRLILVASIVLVSLWMNWQRNKPPLFYQCGLITGLFLALTPGFGVQYLAWFVPWVVGLGAGAAMLYYATSGLFLFLVYTFWSQGFPWYHADSTPMGNWRGYIVYYELACWLAVMLIVSLFFRRFIQVKQARNPLIVGSG